jgi:hypothetical protein
MRKLTTTVLATAVLAGGALSGVGAAAPARHGSPEPERHALKHDSASRDTRSHDARSSDSLRDR